MNVPALHTAPDTCGPPVARRGFDLSQQLNQDCHCLEVPPTPLVAREPVFVSRADADAITAFVAGFDVLVRDPAYVEQALRRAPAIAQHAFGPRGMFNSFDFHLTPQGPVLIEINTNGGGAWLVANAMGNEAVERLLRPFDAEWQAQRPGTPRGRLAIVDDDPAAQALYPEMQGITAALRERGWQARVVGEAALRFDGARLLADGEPIDFVYNRHTDFYLEHVPALRDAYAAGAVVVSPNPHIHALYADKRNLVWLSAAAVSPMVPPTSAVDPSLWAGRKALFFKPATGFGSRAVYRGAKLTQRTWRSIIANAPHYVAQQEITPPLRTVLLDGVPQALKYDVRAFTYEGEVLLFAARLYRGQTTNMHTAGGGLAPVHVVPDEVGSEPPCQSTACR